MSDTRLKNPETSRLHFLTFIIWSSLCRWAPAWLGFSLQRWLHSLSLPQWCYLWKQRETCLSVINPNLFGLLTLTLPHISFSPFSPSPGARYCSHSLSALLTCWQQFVSRYQFSASRLRGREGCGNHLHLRLLGSVPPRHAGRHLPLSSCQAERVWDVGSGYTGHGHFFPKATEAKTLSGIWATCTVSSDTHNTNKETTGRESNSIMSPRWISLI